MNQERPYNRVNVFNTALPAANATISGVAISPVNCDPGVLRIYICISVAGVLTLQRTVGGTTLNELLNNGNALNAAVAYVFNVLWRAGESIQLTYSATGGTINKLQIDETWNG
jgi:hypothetical protein